MENTQTSGITPNKRLTVILLTATTLLCIPLIAMQFTNEVKWNLFDFIIAGILLFGAGATFEFIMRNVKTIKLRIVIGIILFIALFLLWAELAVGIFGTPFAGN